MFFNEETGNLYDLEKTKIELIVKEILSNDKIIYKFNPILVCDN